MNDNSEAQRALVLQIVRGERPWQDLNAMGFQVCFDQFGGSFRQPPGLEMAISSWDLAQGFHAFRHQPARLREWSFVVEALDLTIDWHDPKIEERFSDALWRASFGEPIPEDFFRQVESIVQDDRSLA